MEGKVQRFNRGVSTPTAELAHSVLMLLYQHPNQRTVATALVSSTSCIARLASTAYFQIPFTGPRLEAPWRAERH